MFMKPKTLFCDIKRFGEQKYYIISSVTYTSKCKQYIGISCIVYDAKGIELLVFFYLNLCIFPYITHHIQISSAFKTCFTSFVLININFTNYKSLFLLVFPCNSIPKLYLMQATYTFYIHTIQSMLILKQ